MKHLGPRALTWLTWFYTVVIQLNTIPNYHPIYLLLVPFQIFECFILQRIYPPTVKEVLRVDQAGFRKDRSTGVLALTYIENGFQNNMTGVVFLDLTAAYDTIWHTGLLLKLS
ncbi:hypothetical protein AAFF_G00104050 [Aldrovandia affinis]|uniref:Reverse transcriptase domain-containing protein n=1 Tax=Aldrovandia affinis TaxID=143900 RepID=A0AAD7RUI7_9TELE|nr:hypothetical protein AAFF_G00104050 [Aldrovandia affinis]